MPAKVILTEEQLKVFKDLAAEGATRQKIADTLNIDRSVVTRILKEFNIELVSTPQNRAGKKFIWTPELEEKLKTLYASKDIRFHDICLQFNCSDAIISKKARELGLKKVKHPVKEFSDADIEYIKTNAGKISIQEMAKVLNRCDESIEAVFKKYGLINTYHSRTIPLPDNPKLKEDLSNPAYSNEYLGRIYNYSSGKIRKWRSELFGNRKNMINTFLNKSSAECKLENFLDELHLAYMYNTEIYGWIVDYNLGFNFLIEVQGDYWHGKINKKKQHAKISKTIEKDKIKLEELSKLGYKVLEVWESELSEPDKLKQKISTLLYEQIQNYYKGLVTL